MSDSDPPPTMRHNTPPMTPIAILDEKVDYLLLQVDRHAQNHKLLRWVASTAAVFAIGSSIILARMLYGWGHDDEAMHADIRQVERALENHLIDYRELRNLVYRQVFKLPDSMLPGPQSLGKETIK